MTRRLPPFAPLIAFDAVARHRSFTRAADELGVTQSAVSHQVRRLETFFGVQLLRRLNPGVELSADGAALRAELAVLLDGIAGLEPRLRSHPDRRRLRVGAGPALATWWLVRRLPAFQARHPEIDIEFEPMVAETPGERPFDVWIIWTVVAESRATSTQAPLFLEHVFPVCAPFLLPGGAPLRDPSGLLDLPLIQKGAEPVGEWSWSYWLRKLGLARAEPRGLILRDMSLCLTAATEGSGVALGRSLLVADAMRDGRLASALATPPLVLSTKAHVARWRPDLIGDRSTQILVAWLAQEAEKTTTLADFADRAVV